MSDHQAQIVYADVQDNSAVQGKLFDGLKFWVAQRCPLRSTFIEQIKSNGGQIVPLEKHADYLIADHARKDAPPGSISYRFIERSIRNGALEDPEDHPAGVPAGAVREVASVRPTKGVRTPFTPADDRQLYKWVKDCERKGASVRGNEIYKQLETINPNHPWQSWRDRYVKYLSVKPPAGYDPDDVLSSPPADVASDPGFRSHTTKTKDDVKSSPGQTRRPTGSVRARQSISGFTAQDFNDLIENGDDIQDIPARNIQTSWEKWAEDTNHNWKEWRDFWERKVAPIFEELEGDKQRMKLYNRAWKEWQTIVPRGFAEEWLAYYRAEVRPKFKELEAVGGADGAEDGRESKSSLFVTPTKRYSPRAVSEKKDDTSTPRARSNVATSPTHRDAEAVAAAASTTQAEQETILLSSDVDAANVGTGDGSELESDEELPPYLPPKKRPREDEIQESPIKVRKSPDVKRQRREGSIDVEIVHQTSSLVSRQEITTIISTGNDQNKAHSDNEEDAADAAESRVDVGMAEDVGGSTQTQELIRQRTGLPDSIVAAAFTALNDEQRAEILERVQDASEIPESTQPEPEEGQQVVVVERKEEQVEEEVIREGNTVIVKRTTRVSFAEPLEAAGPEDEEGVSEYLEAGEEPVNEAEDDEEPLFVGTRSRSRSLSASSQLSDNAVSDNTPTGPKARVPVAVELDLTPLEQSGQPFSSPPPMIGQTALDQAVATLDTQAILTAETQIPDLGLAEPEGGFDGEDDEEESEETFARPGHTAKAQDEEEDENMQEDLTALPPPDGGFDDPDSHAYSPPQDGVDETAAIPNSTPDDTPTPAPTLQTFIDRFLAAGHAPADVVTALKATSTNVELAETVLAALEAGRGVPKDVRGVWTERDDRDAESGDGRAVQRVAGKHGWDGPGGIEGRMEFLRRWRS